MEENSILVARQPKGINQFSFRSCKQLCRSHSGTRASHNSIVETPEGEEHVNHEVTEAHNGCRALLTTISVCGLIPISLRHPIGLKVSQKKSHTFKHCSEMKRRVIRSKHCIINMFYILCFQLEQ